MVDAELNGLELSFDAQTGCLVEMSCPGVGTVLDAERGRASVLDLAYPIPAFEPLRLASRYSKDAQIEVTKRKVTITWDQLGMSRKVSADSKQPISYHLEYVSGGYFGSTPMIVKWMDVGGRKGGFSLFRQHWNWGPAGKDANYQEKVWLQHSEVDNRLRLSCMHAVDIKQGEQWESELYLLTARRQAAVHGQPVRERLSFEARRLPWTCRRSPFLLQNSNKNLA